MELTLNDKHPKCDRAGRCLEAIECPEGRCAMRLAAFAPADAPRPMELEDFSDEAIDRIADLTVKAMPEGIFGFCKQWGWRQFARMLLSHYGPTVNRHALNAAQEKARAEALLEGLRQARDAFVSANDQARGPIVDTVWMPGRPQTLLDHLERLIDKGAPT